MSRGRRSLSEALAASRRPSRPESASLPPWPPPPAPEPSGRYSELNAVLISGDLVSAAALWRRTAGAEAAPAPASLATAVRIARAHAWLGRPAPDDLLARAPQLDGRDLAALAALRTAGDEAEQLVWRYASNSNGRSQRVPVTRTEFWDLARMVLRTPSRFSFGEPPEPGEPRRIHISGCAGLLVDLLEEEGHGTRSVQILRGLSRTVGLQPLYVAVAFEAVADGVPTRILASVKIGSTKGDDDEARWRSAAATIRRAHPEMRPLIPHLATAWQGSLGGRGLGILADAPPGGPALTLEGMVGTDTCRHPAIRWRSNGAWTAAVHGADALVATCPTCERGQMAVVPLHRLPSSDNLVRSLEGDPEHEAAYLARQRFYQELAADHRPVESIAALRARDGVVVPTDSLIAPVGVAGVGREDNLAGALARSRSAPAH